MEMKQRDDYLANFTLALLEYTKSGEQIKKIITNLGSPVFKLVEPLLVSVSFVFISFLKIKQVQK